MIVLGVDPGSAVTGFGVVEGHLGKAQSARLVECGVLRANEEALADRLRTLHEGLAELMARHRPDIVAVEGIFYARNVRTTVVLGHARGVILLAAAQADVAVAEYAPRLVKKSVVGTGDAAKSQVGFMVARLLRLAAPPSPADAADGVALALTHLILAPRTHRLIGGPA
jgi:crossover junction endodeoxyribonuclease RuvC